MTRLAGWAAPGANSAASAPHEAAPSDPPESSPAASAVHVPQRDIAAAIFDAKARAEIAWDVRDALWQRVQSPLASPGRVLLREVLREVESARLAREVANAVFFELAARVSPPLSIDVQAAASRICRLSPHQLQRALSPLGAAIGAGTAQGGVTHDAATRTGQRLVQDIVAALLPAAAAMPVFAAVRDAPPFVWGLLAEAHQMSAPELALWLQCASAEELAEAAGFVRARASEWLSMRRATSECRATCTTHPADRARRLIESPDGSRLLLEQQHCLARFVSRCNGGTQEDARLNLRARQRSAGHCFLAVIERVSRCLGPGKAGRVLAGLDSAAEIAAIADLRVGRALYTDLEAREPLQLHSERLCERLAEIALRHQGDDVLAALQARPDGAALAAAVAGDAPHRAELRATLVRHASGASPAQGEALAAYFLRVAGLDPHLLAARLVCECQQDPTGFTDDLVAMEAEKARLQAAVQESQRRERERDEALAMGIVSVSAEVMRAVQEHAMAAYPYESIGYLTDAAGAPLYLPIRNEVAGSELGCVMGMEVAADAARMEEIVGTFGLRVIAKVHSHPEQSPLFSHQDLAGMGDAVALMPGLRSFIVGVHQEPDGTFSLRTACFASDAAGQLLHEDQIDVC
jgi:proteasome lid subunit RPN8/RPN11